MRKKQLLQQNEDLFERLTAAHQETEDLRKTVRRLEEQSEQLRAEIQKITESKDPPPIETVRKKVEAGAKVSQEIRYGASVIGKTVVEAAKCCNLLTGNPADQSVKERVNLILGRTEVAKAEILKWIASDLPYEEKCQKIDGEFLSAQDYFSSMMAQTE